MPPLRVGAYATHVRTGTRGALSSDTQQAPVTGRRKACFEGLGSRWPLEPLARTIAFTTICVAALVPASENTHRNPSGRVTLAWVRCRRPS